MFTLILIQDQFLLNEMYGFGTSEYFIKMIRSLNILAVFWYV